jgi:hypothetical protein
LKLGTARIKKVVVIDTAAVGTAADMVAAAEVVVEIAIKENAKGLSRLDAKRTNACPFCALGLAFCAMGLPFCSKALPF